MSDTPQRMHRDFSGWPTGDELLVLGDYFEERNDARAAVARGVRDSRDLRELVKLLIKRDRHEAACVFAERTLDRERKQGREPAPALWEALEAKRAWLAGEITRDQLWEATAPARTVAEDLLEREYDDPEMCAAWATVDAVGPLGGRAIWRVLAKDADESDPEALWQCDWIMRRAWQSAGKFVSVHVEALGPVQDLVHFVDEGRRSDLANWIDARCRENPEDGFYKSGGDEPTPYTRVFAIHLLSQISDQDAFYHEPLAVEHGWQRLLARLIEESDALSLVFMVAEGTIQLQDRLTEEEAIAIEEYVDEEHHPRKHRLIRPWN